MEDYKAGHRERMKKKYSEQGEGAFYDYQLLEMLLFYAIPRRDTKPLAKELLNRFGSLENLMNADIPQITLSKGVGEKTARLIKLSAEIYRKALIDKKELPTVNSMTLAGDYFNRLLGNEPNENFAIMLLDNGNKIRFFGIIEEETINANNETLKKLTHLVSDHQATALIIAHNHPNGIAKPSGADVNAMLTIRDFMRQLDIPLLDHIIIGSNGAYSMRSDLEYNHYFHGDQAKRGK